MSNTDKTQAFQVTAKLTNGGFGLKHLLSAEYGFGCAGSNMSPEIHLHGAPEGTESFVLMLHDPDAPTGVGWNHWTVVDIPAGVQELAEGAGTDPALLPEGAIQTRTDFGVPGYGGPCPPPGQLHTYVLTVFAMPSKKLHDMITADATPALVGMFANTQALATAKLEIPLTR